jgi:hypothetical protein
MQREYAKSQAAIRLGKDWRPVLVLRRLDYIIERKPTPRSKSGSSLPPTTSILERMAAGVAQTKCLRASTVIRTRAHGRSNNFGNGYRR